MKNAPSFYALASGEAFSYLWNNLYISEDLAWVIVTQYQHGQMDRQTDKERDSQSASTVLA